MALRVHNINLQSCFPHVLHDRRTRGLEMCLRRAPPRAATPHLAWLPQQPHPHAATCSTPPTTRCQGVANPAHPPTRPLTHLSTTAPHGANRFKTNQPSKQTQATDQANKQTNRPLAQLSSYAFSSPTGERAELIASVEDATLDALVKIGPSECATWDIQGMCSNSTYRL